MEWDERTLRIIAAGGELAKAIGVPEDGAELARASEALVSMILGAYGGDPACTRAVVRAAESLEPAHDERTKGEVLAEAVAVIDECAPTVIAATDDEARQHLVLVLLSRLPRRVHFLGAALEHRIAEVAALVATWAPARANGKRTSAAILAALNELAGKPFGQLSKNSIGEAIARHRGKR